MNALVVGFEVEETRRLSQELRAAGHQVLGAVGKQGAWTFLRAISPDVVVIPSGEGGARARGWVLEVGAEVAFVEVPVGADAVARVDRFVRGEPIEEPSLAVAREPEDEVTTSALLRNAHEDEHEGEPEPPPPPPEPASRRQRRPQRDEVSEDEAQAREPHPDLASKLAQVRFGDYHSILEVEPGGSPYAVREQHERLARRFSPRGWPGRLSPEELDMLNEIAQGIADAFLILSDPELAVRYERALSGARPAGGSPPDALPR